MVCYHCVFVSSSSEKVHKGESEMAVSYKKLRHILVDRNMKKKDLEAAAGITHYQMYKIANDKDITTDVLGAICTALNVEPNDIMDFLPSEKT